MKSESLAMVGSDETGAAGGWLGIRARAGRCWRKCATGLCFVMYGATGWFGGLTAVPLVMLWPGSATTRERRIRCLVSWSFRLLLAWIGLLRVGCVEVEGRQWLDQAGGKLLVANHPMYLDVVALIGLLPQADCVIKRDLWRSRLYRRFVAATGYLSNAGSAGLVDDGVAALRRGRTLVLFPEGTRSTPGAPLRFRRGAAQVAVRSGCDVLPVVIRCEPLALGKNQAWHEVSDRPWRLKVHICPPRTLAEWGWREDMPHGVAARRVTCAMETFFARQLEGCDGSAASAVGTLAVGTAEDD